MATMHQYGTTIRRGTQIDLRAPFRATLNAVMRAAEVVNGTTIDGETAVEDQALDRARSDEHASIAGERHTHYA